MRAAWLHLNCPDGWGWGVGWPLVFNSLETYDILSTLEEALNSSVAFFEERKCEEAVGGKTPKARYLSTVSFKQPLKRRGADLQRPQSDMG